MTKRLIGILVLLFAVSTASACPGDKATDDGKGSQGGKKPTTSLIR